MSQRINRINRIRINRINRIKLLLRAWVWDPTINQILHTFTGCVSCNPVSF